jgi:hypothetical protein
MMSRWAPVAFLAAALAACSSPPADTKAAAAPAAPPAAAPAPPAPAPDSDEGMIQSAMAAAPEAVSKDATIIALEKKDDKMAMRTLRKGTNDWTCMPDNPASPGKDSMCLDANGTAWAMAWMGHTAPPKGKIGLGYMLMGGSDASNTDPFAETPVEGHQWVDTGPHIMILNAGTMLSKFPTQSDNTKAPYIMFAGTPYAHLMMPVK